ncbi:DUF7146 domain-containing protein [Pseudorhodoferax sp.]|uniref:DUF7146 domain-containing protein n=1 Tax=Pseudorhodoferax sp. TaxID=1993553 RepID=UPI002DD6366C|nr:toprim domain-containing protein [Pseudorhodoferax sp.]
MTAATLHARHAYEVNRERIASLWAQARPIAPGDAADLYLRANGAAPLGAATTWPETLRMHPALDYWTPGPQANATCQGRFPALLAPLHIDTYPLGLRAPAVPHAVALLRVYLAPGGTLAPVPAPIKRTGTAGPGMGAAVRLAPCDGHANCALGVAVGVVPALRIARALRLPVWAVPDATALAQVRWPRSARTLHVFADPREPAQWAAGAELARKANACGLHVLQSSADLADSKPHGPHRFISTPL